MTPPLPPSPWQRLPLDLLDGATWRPPTDQLVPGTRIIQHVIGDLVEPCTAGAGFVGPDGAEYVATAGHCDKEAGAPVHLGVGPDGRYLGRTVVPGGTCFTSAPMDCGSSSPVTKGPRSQHQPRLPTIAR